MFPKDFLWGAATSSHQVEGNNIHNDWWAWEKGGRVPVSSGEACRHYERFEEDFQLAGDLSHNAHRFSVEWSRIEPREGYFDPDAIRHYRFVIQSLRNKSIEPVVTLHHFTNPQWFAEKGGWLNPQASSFFCRYVERVVEVLGADVHYWITINEPMVLVYHGYVMGLWPPGEKSIRRAWTVVQNLMKAHRDAYKKIHEIYPRHAWLPPAVGVASNLRPFNVCPRTNHMLCRLGVSLRHEVFNIHFLKQAQDWLDFVGVNYYEREYVSTDRALGYWPWGGNCNQKHGHAAHVNTLGWGSFPEGLCEVIGWLGELGKPILITECGTAETTDERRRQFIQEHLAQVQRALDGGSMVIGFLYWSLLDNFEWHHGFGPCFGLIEMDYTTFKRTIRPSGRYLAEVIQRGSV